MSQSGVYHNAGQNSMSSYTFPILLFLSRVLTMLQSTRNSRSIVHHWNNCTGQFRSIIWKAIIIIFVFSLLHLNNHAPWRIEAPELRSPGIFIELECSRELKNRNIIICPQEKSRNERDSNFQTLGAFITSYYHSITHHSSSSLCQLPQ